MTDHKAPEASETTYVCEAPDCEAPGTMRAESGERYCREHFPDDHRCGICRDLGVVIFATGPDGLCGPYEVRPCDRCAARFNGEDTTTNPAELVQRVLNALTDVRDLLWPGDDPDAAWSPDTIDAIARELDFIRPVRDRASRSALSSPPACQHLVRAQDPFRPPL